MSKKYEPLSLEKDLKISYAAMPERTTKTLQIAISEKQDFSKGFHKKHPERFTFSIKIKFQK